MNVGAAALERLSAEALEELRVDGGLDVVELGEEGVLDEVHAHFAQQNRAGALYRKHPKPKTSKPQKPTKSQTPRNPKTSNAQNEEEESVRGRWNWFFFGDQIVAIGFWLLTIGWRLFIASMRFL